MTLLDAFTQAVNEDEDILERAEFSSDVELKTQILEELREAMKKAREAQKAGGDSVAVLKPLFDTTAFMFIIGIRVGKILRDEELASECVH